MELIWIVVILLIFWNSRSVLLRSLDGLGKADTKFYLITSAVIAIILIILSYDVGGPHFVWDSRSFYDWLSALEKTDIFDFGRFFLFSHVDLTYFFSLFLLWQLTEDLAIGYFVYGAICLLVVAFSTVFILKKTVSHRGKAFVLLASVACLFSPYVCGMSTYVTYDFAICCFIPLLILFAINEDWLYFILTAFYVSQLKETGLIFVGAVCIGIIIMELACDKASFLKTVFRKRTFAMLMVAVNFVLFYIVYSDWWKTSAENGGGFGISIEHIKTILKMFIILNFEWAVILATVVLLFIAIVKTRNINKYVIIYASTAVFPLLFYMLYITGTYPRYTDAFPVCILLIFVTALASLKVSDVVWYGSVVLLSVLMITSSFFSFDPLSERLLISEDVGDSTIYFSSFGFDFGGDPCVYNRHYYGMDIVFDKALKKAMDSNVDLIAVSNGNNRSTWAIDGGMYAYNESMEKRIFTEFWNVKKAKRDPIYKWEYFDDPNYIPLDIRYIFPNDDIISSLQTGDSFIYIYMPTQNGDREKIVRDAFDISEEGSFTSHGWVLSYIVGSKK